MGQPVACEIVKKIKTFIEENDKKKLPVEEMTALYHSFVTYIVSLITKHDLWKVTRESKGNSFQRERDIYKIITIKAREKW